MGKVRQTHRVDKLLNERPTRVALYGRVSSEEQANAGTIENQVSFLHRYCDLHEMVIAGEYLDVGVSGTIPFGDRPAGGSLIRDAENDRFDVVLAYRIDRLSRNTVGLLTLADRLTELGVGVKSATEEFNTETATGRLIMTILASFAAHERETIMERTQLGQVRVAAQGRIPGGTLPFGYRVIEGVVRVVEAEAALVRRIFALYLDDRLGTATIANLLNAERVPPVSWWRGKQGTAHRGKPSGASWAPSQVHHVLTNPVYKGEFSYGKLRVPCPPIVEPDRWDAARATMERNKLMAGRNTKYRTYLLKSLIRCGVCGRRYVGTGNAKHGIFGYECPGGPEHCPAPRLPAVPIETAIWREVQDFVRNPGPVLDEISRRLAADATSHTEIEADIAEADRQIGALDEDKRRVLALYRKGRLGEADLDQQMGEVEGELSALAGRRDALVGRLVAAKERETSLLGAEVVLDQLRARVEALDPVRQQGLISALVAGLRVRPGDDGPIVTVTYRFAAPDAPTAGIDDCHGTTPATPPEACSPWTAG
jgi:site-specific DNA recombinase